MFRNKAFNIVMIVIVAIALLGIVGYVGWTTLVAPTLGVQKEAEVEPPAASELLAAQFDIGKMTTNLQGDALIQASFTIQGESEDVKNEVEERKLQIRDILNSVLHQTTQADIQKADGLVSLKARLVEAVNQVMLEGKVTDVLITDIVVQ
ncbi:MAG TPA: flagellar basal body-associated FliL family protein [Bacilli bacterium]|nr:flagellar basal body-associated FliL family protein [Bacilli bacterium]